MTWREASSNRPGTSWPTSEPHATTPLGSASPAHQVRLAFPGSPAGADLRVLRAGSLVPLTSALLPEFLEIGPDLRYTVVTRPGAG